MRCLKFVFCLYSLVLTSCVTNSQDLYHPPEKSVSTIKGVAGQGNYFTMHMNSPSTSVTAIDHQLIELNEGDLPSKAINISPGKHLITAEVTFDDGWKGDAYRTVSNILLHVNAGNNYTVEATRTKNHVQTWIVDGKGNLASNKTTVITIPANAYNFYIPELSHDRLPQNQIKS